MELKKLSLDHKQILFDRLKGIDTGLSEYSFSNLFLFRETHKYHVLFDEHVFIRGVSYDGSPYIMPVSDLTTVDRLYIDTMFEHCKTIFPVPEEWLSLFDDSTFAITSIDSDSDYIFTVDKISTYRGRKLHSKRAHLNNFLARHEAKALPLLKENMSDAHLILNEWQAVTGALPHETDYLSCKEALDLYDELVLCGGIYYADNKPAGFLIGEELRPDTFALHFAKANREFPGIYQYMFNNFATVLPSQYRYLNLEQDLGIETLRSSKTSYIPDMKLKKHRVTMKV